jgi:signal transduction histidine kinase/DNA-binding response OmpR family regulator
MKWNLSKNISSGLFIALLVLSAVGIISYTSLNTFRDIRRNEIKTRNILSGLENVNSYFKDIETGSHGYVLTGDLHYLEPYNNAKSLLGDELGELVTRFEQKEKIGELKSLLDKKIEYSDQVIRLKNSGGQEKLINEILTGEGKNHTEKIRNLLLELEIEETRLFDLHSTRADSNAGYALMFIIFGNLLALLFFIAAVYLLNRDIGKRIRTEIVLNRFIVKAEQAQKKEEQFLAHMSHEIRTPMNAILGMTNLILNTPLEPKQESYLKAIRQSGENLMVIINEILDFSKITAGKIEFEKTNFNLSDIFYGLYNTFKIKADEKNLKLLTVLDENLPDTIIGDPGKLNQVLINLIGNSIKFTLKGNIEMSCRLLDMKEDQLLIEFAVKDTGIGIPKEKLSTIFEDFAQASTDTSRKFGGTGLGLSISKKIVELQGGKIKVDSTLGVGTIFSFSLWFKKGTEKIEKKEKSEARASIQELHGLKILVVDDNEFNRVVAVDTLNSLIKNLQIDVAENGKIAIEKLKNQKDYKIILMDVQMPEMNGYETTKYIRKHEVLGYSEVPIIAMTASATKPEIERCFDSGMSDFVSKPFDPEILVIKIASLINKDKNIPDKTGHTQENNIPENKPELPANLAFLKNMTGGNKEQVLKYINMFLDSIPDDWQKLKQKAEEKQWEEVRLLAHSMKPRINYLGIKTGGELIRQIEQSAGEKISLENIPQLIVSFENILYLTCKQLEAEKQTL